MQTHDSKPSEATVSFVASNPARLSSGLRRVVALLLLGAFFVSTVGIAHAAGSLSASRARVAQASSAAAQAAAHYRAVEESRSAALALLNSAVLREQNARRRLARQSALSYRIGPGSTLSVLMGAQSFENLIDRWDFLRRVSAQRAETLRVVEQAHRRAIAQANQLLLLQERASAELARSLRARRSALAALRAKEAASRKSPSADDVRVKPTPRPPITRHGTGDWLWAKASHYGPGSWGHKTADGTRIRSNSMIVAHKTLPFGTLVEFRFNGKVAVGRVADRGPYVKGRMWDLGPGVIAILHFNGVHQLEYRIIGKP